MPVELVFARQERPVGLSTLDQVRALRDEAEAAASTAATDAVEAAGPAIAEAIQGAVGQAATDAATQAAAAVAPAAADAIRAQVSDDADRAEAAAGTAATEAATLAAQQAAEEVAPVAAAAIRAEVQADLQTAQAAAGTATSEANRATLAASTAAVNANVYPDIATGRAAVADGAQFQVVAGDEYVRYRRDSATTQTEVGRFPSAILVGAVRSLARDTAGTISLNLASLARAKSGLYVSLNPIYCFKERAVDAATPARVGDLVGSVKSADGSFFLIAQQDDRRPYLRQDTAGNYYLDTTNANLIVRNADGTFYDPTSAWTHIGGWVVGGAAPAYEGYIFSWSGVNNQNRGVQIRSVNNSGNSTRTQIALNTFGSLFSITQDPATIPHVLRVVKSLADIAAYHDDNPVRRAPPLVPWDDSAIARRLALFSNNPQSTAGAHLPGGKFYGGLWVPGTLTDSETKFATAEIMRLTKPTRLLVPADPVPVVLDFAANAFSWGNNPKTVADLTSNGGGSYTLTDMRWWSQEHTIIIDAISDPNAGAWSGDMVVFNSDNVSNEKLFVAPIGPSFRLGYSSPVVGLASPYTSPNPTAFAGEKTRWAVIVKPGEVVQSVLSSDITNTNSVHMGAMAIPPTSVTINTVVPGWTVTRVSLYGKALSREALWDAMIAGNVTPIHVLGDSFTRWASDDFSRQLYIAAGNPAPISTDGIGGLAFYEPDGRGHSQRYALTPENWKKTLILNDGALETGSGRPSAVVQASIMDTLLYQDSGRGQPKRYLFLEGNPINVVGDERRTVSEEATAYVKFLTGERYVETLAAMFCAYTSPEDIVDVGNGIWPRSLSSDGVHYLAPGRIIYARAAAAALKDFGWVPGTTTLPGAPQALAATGSAITWAPPADDGGHPILGYDVQRNTGAWVSQAPQGSAAGYTRQYIRAWTAPAAGSYRVAAITRKGAGPYATVTVA